MARAIQIPALTGLRGAGAVWVLLFHWNLFFFGHGHGVHVLDAGYVGVDLFFMLSGFVLSYSKYEALRHPGWRAYCRFLAERIVRLYPTNAAVLIVFALAAAAVPRVWENQPAFVSSPTSFLTSLLLIQSWVPLPLNGWIAPGWSVSAEMGAYVALPALLFIVRRMRTGRAAFGAAFVVLLALMLLFVAMGKRDLGVIGHGGVLRLAFEFTAGALLYQSWRLGFRVPQAATAVAIAGLIVAGLTIPAPETSFLFLPAFALLLLVAAQDEGAVAKLFSSAPAMFLGRISYSLYLVHWPVLMFWTHVAARPPFTAPWLAANILMLLATIAVATVVHHAIEAPSHRWARRLTHRAGKLRHATGALQTDRLTAA